MKIVDRWLSSLIVTFFLIFLGASCGDVFNTDEYSIDQIKASPSLTLPLIHGDLVIQDLIGKVDKNQKNVKVASDGTVYLSFEQTLKTQGIQDLLTFPNKNFNLTLPLVGGSLPARTTESQSAPVTQTVDFEFSPEKLSEIKFKTTTINVSVTFTPSSPASNIYDIQVRLPNFKNESNVVFQNRVSPGIAGSTFQLQNYVATLSNNTFPVEIVFIEKPHAATTITNPTTANISINFNTIDFRYVKGFFGDQTVNNAPEDVIEFSTFGEAWSKAKVSFADPKLSFTVSNDYGIPTKVTFNPIEAQKGNGSSIPVTLNPSSPIPVNAPAELGKSAITSVQITNAKQLLDFVPEKFKYKVSARINEGFTTGNNFCADTSKINVNFKAEIPLYGRASGIVMADTFAIDLSDSDNSNIESGGIKARIKNELPLDGNVQLYLANDKYVIFDSLFTTAQTGIVKASKVTAAGELQEAGLYDQEISIAREKLDKIFDAKNIIIKARMGTSKDASGNQVDVKFKAAYKMSINFGIKAKLKLQVDL